jgi:alkylhydroperoxidase/carboxymuconolactone decarboxylase family protein YurZ
MIQGVFMKAEEFKTRGLLLETGASPHLTDREKHLIGMAVTSTRGCIACTGGRIRKALEAGVPYETVVAGIDLASAVNAGTTLAIATQGADLTKVDELCPDGICTVGTK